MPQQPPQVAKAILMSLGRRPTKLQVHFNPSSMVYTVENSTPQQSDDPKKRQTVATFSGKLSMDLQFDTTDTGDDVRQFTQKVARFMQASGNSELTASNAAAANPAARDSNGQPPHAQPVLCFQWGAYEFRGTMESFKETIDFFSEDGIPLRALVSITLARQDKIFDEETDFIGNTNGSLVPSSAGDSALSAATRGGDPGSARQLASDNGLESLRFTAGATLQVNASVRLNAAAGFSGAGSTGLQLPAGGGGGAIFGGQASAGVAASAGAFAGLETGRAAVSTTAQLDPTQMMPAVVSADTSTYSGASFSIGGAALNGGGAGLSADVGAKFSFSDRLLFDSDD